MNAKEIERLHWMRTLAEARTTQLKAADALRLTPRHVRRLYEAYSASGAAALASRRRGTRSNRTTPDEVRVKALSIVRAMYADFGPTLAQEKLAELHGLAPSVETLRNWMIADGLWSTRRERKKRVQQPRHRRACLGELIQIDGCLHDWFEGRGPRCTVLVYVDDASGRLMELRFARSESTFEYFEATRSYLKRHGKPHAFYSDKAAIFRVNAKNPKAGDGFTQFGRAMHDLNIDVICANTPRAKGRVERAHQVLQDRLVKELRLRAISTMADANAYVPEFIEDYNRRFGRSPASSHDSHRPLLEHETLDRVFTWQEERCVTQNLTLHYKRVMYLLYGIAVVPARPMKPKDKAKVENAVLVAQRWILACLRNRTFFSLDELSEAIAELLERLNTRAFKKLDGCRRSAFEQLDQPALLPLPPTRYEVGMWSKAKVNIDYCVELEGMLYSVPCTLVGARVELRSTAAVVEILLENKRVASHRRCYGRKGTATIVEEHRPKSHRQYGAWPPSRIVGWASNLGPAVAQLVELILADKPHPEQGYRSCMALFRDAKRYPNDRVDAACARAIAIGAPNRRSVHSILLRGLDQLPLEEPVSVRRVPHENVRGAEYFDRKENLA